MVRLQLEVPGLRHRPVHPLQHTHCYHWKPAGTNEARCFLYVKFKTTTTKPPPKLNGWEGLKNHRHSAYPSESLPACCAREMLVREAVWEVSILSTRGTRARTPVWAYFEPLDWFRRTRSLLQNTQGAWTGLRFYLANAFLVQNTNYQGKDSNAQGSALFVSFSNQPVCSYHCYGHKSFPSKQYLVSLTWTVNRPFSSKQLL